MLPAVAAPIVLTDDTGRQVTLSAPARRIVSLAPHITETLYAAGAGQYLVGATSFSDHPPEAKRLARVGGYARLNLEAILRLSPDLLIAWADGNAPGDLEKLSALGLQVFITRPKNIEDIARQLENYGRLAGTEQVANAAAATFRQHLEDLKRRYSARAPVKVFYQIWNAPLMTVGGRQMISSAIRLCGGVNVFGQLSALAPTVSEEAVLAADPDVIIATGMAEARPEWLDDWRRWPRLTAVRRDNLFFIQPDLIQRHTPRLLEGAEILCRQLERARAKKP